jgi:hypothetical protein
MSVIVTAEVRATHVRLHCLGVFDFSSALMLLDQAFELARQTGLEAVLIDARELEGAPTTMERYHWGVQIATRSAAGPRIRIAVVGNEPIIDPDRFGEIVATNRGASGRAFTDLQEAIAWLGCGSEETSCAQPCEDELL